MLGRRWPDLLPMVAKMTTPVSNFCTPSGWRTLAGTMRGMGDNQGERVLQASLSPLHGPWGVLTGSLQAAAISPSRRGRKSGYGTSKRWTPLASWPAVSPTTSTNLLQIVMGNADSLPGHRRFRADASRLGGDPGSRKRAASPR